MVVCTYVECAVIELSPGAAADEGVPAGVPGGRRQRVLLGVSHLQVQLLRLHTDNVTVNTRHATGEGRAGGAGLERAIPPCSRSRGRGSPRVRRPAGVGRRDSTLGRTRRTSDLPATSCNMTSHTRVQHTDGIVSSVTG